MRSKSALDAIEQAPSVVRQMVRRAAKRQRERERERERRGRKE